MIVNTQITMICPFSGTVATVWVSIRLLHPQQRILLNGPLDEMITPQYRRQEEELEGSQALNRSEKREAEIIIMKGSR